MEESVPERNAFIEQSLNGYRAATVRMSRHIYFNPKSLEDRMYDKSEVLDILWQLGHLEVPGSVQKKIEPPKLRRNIDHENWSKRWKAWNWIPKKHKLLLQTPKWTIMPRESSNWQFHMIKNLYTAIPPCLKNKIIPQTPLKNKTSKLTNKNCI